MGNSYSPQSDFKQPSTMSVRALIALLEALPDHDAPVVFNSPRYGAYGPNHMYTVDRVGAVKLEREVLHIPARTGYDDETGEEYAIEAEDQVFHAWEGVVIE